MNRRLFLAAALVLAAACRDASSPVAPLPSTPLLDQRYEQQNIFDSYTAIGTSVSAGTCSNGNVADCQRNAWPAQLARFGGSTMTLPLIGGTGCAAPIATPLTSFLLTSGEPVTTPGGQVKCTDNLAGVQLPTQDLAIPGALTSDALLRTPELQTDPFGSRLYRRYLPLGETQVTAMEKENPRLVSVELGANDIVGVRNGVVIAGVSYVPYDFWAAAYDQIVARARARTTQGVLVGLISDVATFPGFRRGWELWNDRTDFLSAFNVQVSDDCRENLNILFVPVRALTAVANGLGRRAVGAPPYALSCIAVGGTTEDYVLTPDEVTFVNQQLARMNSHIREKALLNGFAYFDLRPLYNLPKGRYSVVKQMTDAHPYGLFISNDGFHPTAAGHSIIAGTAAIALIEKYHLRIFAPLPH